MRTVLIAVLACALAIFTVGCVSGTGGQTTAEVARWHDSATFWRSQVNLIRNQLENPPPGVDLLDDKTRRSLTDALATAEWYLRFFEGLTVNASTQPVPVVAPVK